MHFGTLQERVSGWFKHAVSAKRTLKPTLNPALNRHAYSTRLIFRFRQSSRQSSRDKGASLTCSKLAPRTLPPSLRHTIPIREIREIRSFILPRSGHPKKSCKSCNPVKIITAEQARKILKIVSLIHSDCLLPLPTATAAAPLRGGGSTGLNPEP